ncbi:MAG: ubiquinol-cytochrome C chaperone family protein [Hyphomicrobiaceae bacterium]
MFTWLAKRSQTKRKARDLYGAVVAQARNPAFYIGFGVADTPVGRYELIALHLILALDRLGQSDVVDEVLRRETLETFVTDLDDAMREFGVGDPTVPKRVKHAAGGVYARDQAYRAALADPGNAALEHVLAENVYQAQKDMPVQRLAAYVRSAVTHLKAQSADTLRSGVITFPNLEQQS